MNPLRRGVDPEKLLRDAGLKFERSERDEKIYFNLHASMGKCLVKGSLHGSGNERNNRCSAFVWNPVSGELWYQCFAGSCMAASGKTRIALAALGLSLDDIVVPAYLEVFDSPKQFAEEKELVRIIDNFAFEESMNMVGGLSGHGKTWIMLAICRSLLDGSKLFDNFQASRSKNGALYLVPEVGRKSFLKRAKTIGLVPFINEGSLLVRTLSMGPTLPLTDKRILKAAEGRDVFCDTAVRFLEGEENASKDNNLAADGFRLLQEGARSWWGAHHSQKSFENATHMSLENVLRGTGDFGAMLSTCYAVKQLDESKTLLHVERVKDRDGDEEAPRLRFQIEDKPWLTNEGRFRMVTPPSECGPLSEYSGKQGKDRGDMLSRIQEELRKTDGNKSVAAKNLGVTRQHINRLLREEHTEEEQLF